MIRAASDCCCVQSVEQVDIESLLASTDDNGEPSEEFQVRMPRCFCAVMMHLLYTLLNVDANMLSIVVDQH